MGAVQAWRGLYAQLLLERGDEGIEKIVGIDLGAQHFLAQHGVDDGVKQQGLDASLGEALIDALAHQTRLF